MREVQYEPDLLDGQSIRVIYTLAAVNFRMMFGHVPREGIESLLSTAWDRAECKTEMDFNRFYRNSLLMTEEGAKWHTENHGQRLRRVIHAGTIARQLGFNSFAEVGAGIGTDGVALAKLGFENKYLAEINQYSLKLMQRTADVAGVKITTFDLWQWSKEKAQEYHPGADWLFSSDVFEHIRDLESWLDGFVDQFKCVIVYAPFGISDKNHAHTSYTKLQFNQFMDAQGFEKVKVRGLGIPPMVYLRRESNG